MAYKLNEAVKKTEGIYYPTKKEVYEHNLRMLRKEREANIDPEVVLEHNRRFLKEVLSYDK